MIGVTSMRGFFGYWFAVLKLTQAQAFAQFYKFVRYVGTRGDQNPHRGSSYDEFRKGDDEVRIEQEGPKWYDFPPASHCSVGVKNCKDPDCPVKKELARMDAARKKDQGDDDV
jgi:hypothetical protein